MRTHPALAGAALALGLLAATVAPAGVGISIGIDLPAPPAVVAVPGTGVLYAPAVAANYFFYGGRYWVFSGNAWYESTGYNGPWVVAAPGLVPPAILAVPVRYYRVPPRAWRGWRRDAAPRWEARWRRGGRERGRPPGDRHDRRHEARG